MCTGSKVTRLGSQQRGLSRLARVGGPAEGDDAHDQRCQDHDQCSGQDPALVTGPLNLAPLTIRVGQALRFQPLRPRQELAIYLTELGVVLGRPRSGFVECLSRHQHAVGLMGSLPFDGQPLERNELRVSPRRVTFDHRADHPVVGQFVPVDPTTAVGADEIGVLQLPQNLGPISSGKLRHLGAKPLTGDQRRLEPVANRPFRHARLGGHHLDLVGVELAQRMIGVGVRLDIGDRHLVVVIGKTRPQLATHHLELYRFDIHTQLELGLSAVFGTHRTKVIDQAGEAIVGERHPGRRGWPANGGLGSDGVEKIEPHPG